jgi:hypothetical protein
MINLDDSIIVGHAFSLSRPSGRPVGGSPPPHAVISRCSHHKQTRDHASKLLNRRHSTGICHTATKSPYFPLERQATDEARLAARTGNPGYNLVRAQKTLDNPYTTMLTCAMLARQIIPPAPPNKANPFAHILLRTLGRHDKSQLLCNQSNPDSFCKTPGVGVPAQLARRFFVPSLIDLHLPLFSWSYRIAFPARPLLSQTSALPPVFWVVE